MGRLEVLRGDASQVRLSRLPARASLHERRPSPALALKHVCPHPYARLLGMRWRITETSGARSARPECSNLCSAESEAPARPRLKTRKLPSRRQVVVGDDNSVLFKRSVGALRSERLFAISRGDGRVPAVFACF